MKEKLTSILRPLQIFSEQLNEQFNKELQQILLPVEKVLTKMGEKNINNLAEDSEFSNAGFFYQQILELLKELQKQSVILDTTQVIQIINTALEKYQKILFNNSYLTAIVIEPLILMKFFTKPFRQETIDEKNRHTNWFGYGLYLMSYIYLYIEIAKIISKTQTKE